MFKKILIPVDGSDPSASGVQLGVDLARDLGAEVIFTHVVDLAQVGAVCYPGVDAGLVLDASLSGGRQFVADAKAIADKAAVKCSGTLVEGMRLDALLESIREYGVDLVVMGSHGRSGISRAFLGSTTEGLLRHSPVPVLVAAHAPVLSAVHA